MQHLLARKVQKGKKNGETQGENGDGDDYVGIYLVRRMPVTSHTCLHAPARGMGSRKADVPRKE